MGGEEHRNAGCAIVKVQADRRELGGLGLPQPQYVRDYPAGAGRYVQRARGYAWTVVNGAVFLENGEHTGALAGHTLRHGS